MVAKSQIICPLCASDEQVELSSVHDIEYCTVDIPFSYMNCLHCDAIYIHPMPVKLLSTIYPDNYYSISGTKSASFLEYIKELIDKRIFRQILNSIPGEELRVLDVGGGSGWVLNIARDTDKRINKTEIVDLNEDSRKIAESNGHIFHCARIEEYYSKEKFDFVIMLNLIEHVSDPKSVLNSMYKLLKPNGKILIKTPNTKSIDRYIFQHKYWGGYHAPRHWILFNEVNFRELTESCGFFFDWVKYTQGAPQWTASILGVLSIAKLITINKEKPMSEHFLMKPLLALTAALDLFRAPFSKTAQMYIVLKK